MKKSGFTLIELLIVVTIIAILMAIGFISYRIFVNQAKDAQRKADLKFIQSALEQYHADQHYYPPTSKVVPGQPLKNPDESKTYLTTIPKDPSGSVEYSYVARGVGCSDTQPVSCTNYCLYAGLNYPEGVQSDLGCRTQPEGYNYGVTRP